MQPKKIIVEKWDCGFGHKHKDRAGAERCIANRTKPPRLPKPRKWTKERVEELAKLRESGRTYRELGAIYKLSPTTILGLIGPHSDYWNWRGMWKDDRASK